MPRARGPSFEEVSRIDKLDTHTVKVVYKKPQPFWGAVFTSGGLLPRHVFEPLKGASSRDAIGMVKPVGTGPYKLVEFKPGDLIRAEINPTYHVTNRPYFDRLDIKCGGDSPSAVRAVMQTGEYDFAYYVLIEEDVLRRLEQGATKGRILTIPSPAVSFIQLNHSDPWTEVDGERSSPRSTHPFLSDPAVRTALGLLVDRASIQEHLVGRTGQITANFLNAPDRFRSQSLTWEFNVDKANQILDQAGWARAADGIRAKDGKRLKMLYQAAANSTVQKVQMVVKQAAARAGIEIEVKAVQASVFFASDVNNPDTNVRFLADLQTYTTFTGLDPQGFMAQFVSWEHAVAGEQVDRPEHRPLAERALRPALAPGRRRDGSREARGALHPHERPGGEEGRGDSDHVAQRAARRRQLARGDRVQWLGLDLRQHRLLVPRRRRIKAHLLRWRPRQPAQRTEITARPRGPS